MDDFTLGRQLVEFDTDDLPAAERRAFIAANVAFPAGLGPPLFTLDLSLTRDFPVSPH